MLETLVILYGQLLVVFHCGSARGIGTHNLVVVMRHARLYPCLGVNHGVETVAYDTTYNRLFLRRIEHAVGLHLHLSHQLIIHTSS